MEISRAQMRAIEIIRQYEPKSTGEFIRRMWPEKVGPREKISGGFVLAALVLLGRATRAGLLTQWCVGSERWWVVSPTGLQAFYEEQAKRLGK